MIGIIVAEDTELQPFLALVDERGDVREVGGRKFYAAKIGAKDVVIVLAGIGRANAAQTTTLLCSMYSPSLVINSGSAGGLAEGLNIGDIVVAESCVYADVDCRCFGYKFGQVPQMPERYPASPAAIAAHRAASAASGLKAITGVIATTESFCCTEEAKQNILTNCGSDVKAVEMEGAAVAQVCHNFKTPFLVVRSVSDNGKDHTDYEQFAKEAGKKSALLTVNLVKSLQ